MGGLATLATKGCEVNVKLFVGKFPGEPVAAVQNLGDKLGANGIIAHCGFLSLLANENTRGLLGSGSGSGLPVAERKS
jgi:hypothetical protein